ncbi:hypothetical protein D3C75_642680 [compost metagenome]
MRDTPRPLPRIRAVLEGRRPGVERCQVVKVQLMQIKSGNAGQVQRLDSLRLPVRHHIELQMHRAATGAVALYFDALFIIARPLFQSGTRHRHAQMQESAAHPHLPLRQRRKTQVNRPFENFRTGAGQLYVLRLFILDPLTVVYGQFTRDRRQV